jgi:teichuronic acid biosynthesis glycosyltransferase TuaC
MLPSTGRSEDGAASAESKALRVLTFTSLFPNGIDPAHGIFIYQRVAHLASQGRNTVEVVAPVPFFPRWLHTTRWDMASRLPPVERIGAMTVRHPRYLLLPKVSMPLHGLLMYWGCLPLVRRLHASARFDCIDAHFVYPDGFAAVLLGKKLGVPVIVSARGSDINLYPSFGLIRPMIRWTLRNAAACVAVSAALKDAMAKVVGLGIPIYVIPNGVDPARFQPVPIPEARQQLGLPSANRLIVAVGALIKGKGHHFLIRAIRELAPRYPDLQLYILGEGPNRRALEKLISELGLGGQVHLMGKRPNEELRLWFSAAQVSCLASSREGWPNVVSESLACGAPVVATRVGGIPEIVRCPEFGVLVEQTPESIAAGLDQALSKNWNREEISKRTLARTWEIVASEVEEVFAAQVPRDARCSSDPSERQAKEK